MELTVTVRANIPMRLALILFAVIGPAGSVCRAGAAEEDTAPASQNDFGWYAPDRPLDDILAELARAQGLDASDYRLLHSSGIIAPIRPTGSVSAVTAGGKKYAVAVQTLQPMGVPGISADQIVLLSKEGKILGRLRCEINSGDGTVKTRILQKRDEDGARIVVEFAPGGYLGVPRSNYWHTWHRLTFGGKSWTFMTLETKPSEPDIWSWKGLCRLGIASGQLAVIFPKLEVPDLTKAKLLTIEYDLDRRQRHIALDDPKKLSAVLSSIHVAERRQYYPEPDEKPFLIAPPGWRLRGPEVTFLFPGGEVRRMLFVSRGRDAPVSHRDLADARRGFLILDSDAFYRAVAECIKNREGNRVELWHR